MSIKKIVTIKIGSSVLLTARNKLDEFRIAHIRDQISTLRESGIEVVLIVSGAVACGSQFINVDLANNQLRQAAAGIGQAYLITIFYELFRQKHLQIAQILLTKKDLDSKENRQRLISTLEFYVRTGVVPVLNENDVVELNSFGGNDFLAAEITQLLGSDRLVLLSSMKGSAFSIGGGKTKQQVVRSLNQKNIETHIVDGKVKNILLTKLL